ncbi:LysR family transcriptional regulator [Hephaestia mangrovi]|uniref:LysR family transcriptional regulator n=1 Tax=Hephaestia mangrovi TaxID=2873268 RepID=UPI001CA77F50|nr:LysR family transcriptional regulator [Hephaestia mangrovi]MBY8829846.1 LysR family transcriptional regulator [Hephaestia mangrovi]
MTLFAAAVEHGSLAAAARRHGRSPAAITRAVAMLERYAGETLLLRSTRKLSLTPAGERHLGVWREVLARLEEAGPPHPEAPIKGSIVVTAPELFGRLEVMPMMEDFLGLYPDVSARVLLVNCVVDLIGEGVDLAVRVAPLRDSTLTVIKVGEMRTLVCASPEYLDRKGVPASPQDLAHHDCIGLNTGGDAELWPFKAAIDNGARIRSVRVHTRLTVNNAGASIDAARRGQGIIRPRAYQVADDIAAGRLVRLMPMFEPSALPVNIVFHPDRGRARVVRSFIDHAVPAMKRELLRIDAIIPAPGREQ